MKKVVNSLFGYRDPKPDEDFTDVIYTKNEYYKNENDLRDLRDQIKKLEKECDKRIEVYKRFADDKIAEIRDQTNQRITEVAFEMNQHKEKAERFENMNKNLIRVATERANVQRGLVPKKERDGYVFLNLEEFTFNCECQSASKSNKTVFIKLPCFRIFLQSPYQVNFDFDSAKDLIYNDFLNRLMEKLGVESLYDNGLGNYDENEVREFWNGNENFIFKMGYKANFVKGFWEVECLTRFMVVVPKGMVNDNYF